MCHALCGNEADSSSVSSLLSKPRQLKPAILIVRYDVMSLTVLLIVVV